MASLDIVGSRILRPQGLAEGTLSLAEGLIRDGPAGRRVDLSGYTVLPGIVDVHGDGFERHLAPRRGAMKQMAEGILATEAELAANGITTAVLAQFVSWEGGLRGEDFAADVFEAVHSTAPSLVTDIRCQMRLETHLLHLYARVPEMLARWGVDYIVFNDHLPHERLGEGRQPPRMVGQALKAGRNPEAHFAHLLELHALSAKVPPALDGLCADLLRQGVRMGSHDDNQSDQRKEWRRRGVRIAEFPETQEAAEAAKSGGDLVVLGAPNVVRGASHKGNVSALDLISMGLCDAIASDYHYPSPRRAALMLARSGVLPIEKAWALVSEGPSRVLGLHDRGSLEPGKRADLVILDTATDRVAATMVHGRFSYMSGAIFDRFCR